MLLALSDLHLSDGTLGTHIDRRGFEMFANRIRELVYQASWRADGRYQPITSLDILLLGDIFDTIQTLRWLSPVADSGESARPWHDQNSTAFQGKVREISEAIVANQGNALDTLAGILNGQSLQLPPATCQGKPDFASAERICPQVTAHYMVGNHDWYYLVPGAVMDETRRKLMNAIGLEHSGAPFAYHPEDDPALQETLQRYKLVARHGDIFDGFTYNREHGRQAASLADMCATEVVFRFPYEIQKHIGASHPAIARAVQQITNIRPVLAAPMWLRTRIREITVTQSMEKKVKDIWNEIINDFISLSAVDEVTRRLPRAEMQALRFILGLTRHPSMQSLADITGWLTRNMREGEVSLARHARNETQIKNKSADFVVYGHTHIHEVIALDDARKNPHHARQVYINTGAWGTFYANALQHNQKLTNFLTCAAFYNGDERSGRRFETWWVNFT